MQKNLKSTLYLLAMLAGIFLNSCQNNKELEETVNSVIKIDGQSLKHVNLFFTDNEKSFNCELDTPEQEKTFNALKNHFSGEMSKITTKPFLLTIYTKNGLRDIKFDDVVGISVFVKDNTDNLFQHRFFIVENNTTKEDARFSAKCSQIVTDNIGIMGEIIFKNKQVTYGSMASSSKKSNVNEKVTTNKNATKKVVDMLSPIISQYSSAEINARERFCETCRPRVAGSCIMDDGGWGTGPHYTCFMPRGNDVPTGAPGPCPKDKVKNTAEQSNLNTSEITSNEILYDFRDNFMANSNKGRSYIDYYYALGAFMTEKSTINTGNISQYLQFTLITCTIANKLKNGNDNEIIITSSYKENALQIINNLRTQAGENTGVANILNVIEEDLYLYMNKTRIEILNTLN